MLSVTLSSPLLALNILLRSPLPILSGLFLWPCFSSRVYPSWSFPDWKHPLFGVLKVLKRIQAQREHDCGGRPPLSDWRRLDRQRRRRRRQVRDEPCAGHALPVPSSFLFCRPMRNFKMANPLPRSPCSLRNRLPPSLCQIHPTLRRVQSWAAWGSRKHLKASSHYYSGGN